MRAARRARILAGVDLSRGRCLEIGPLANPVVTPEVADVRYVDVVDRDGLIAHYAGNPAVDPAAIPEQHFWLTRPDGSVSTLAEAVAADGPYQHVVASHVIEHVPDMIGWLRDVGQVLTPDGALILAVPDRRYSFDVHRPPASVGQVVQAHLAGDRTPSARAVLDHFMRAVDYPADRAWAGEPPPERGTHPVDDVQRHLARQRAGEYVDCHVWPTSPRAFGGLLDDLLALGLLDFAIERLTATRFGDQEFYLTLRPLPASADREREVVHAREVLAELCAALPEEASIRPRDAGATVPAHVMDDLARRLAESQERLATLRRSRDRLRTQRDRARAQLAAGPQPATGGVGGLRQVLRRIRRS